jgi:hypothetical protein
VRNQLTSSELEANANVLSPYASFQPACTEMDSNSCPLLCSNNIVSGVLFHCISQPTLFFSVPETGCSEQRALATFEVFQPQSEQWMLLTMLLQLGCVQVEGEEVCCRAPTTTLAVPAHARAFKSLSPLSWIDEHQARHKTRQNTSSHKFLGCARTC